MKKANKQDKPLEKSKKLYSDVRLVCNNVNRAINDMFSLWVQAQKVYNTTESYFNASQDIATDINIFPFCLLLHQDFTNLECAQKPQHATDFSLWFLTYSRGLKAPVKNLSLSL